MSLEKLIFVMVLLCMICVIMFGIYKSFPFTVKSFCNVVSNKYSLVKYTRRNKSGDILGTCECCGSIIIKNKDGELKRCTDCYAKLIWQFNKNL